MLSGIFAIRLNSNMPIETSSLLLLLLILRTLFLFIFLCNNAFSEGIFSSKNDKKTFLSSDEAFQVSLEEDSRDHLLINFKVADGYYLYKDKIKIYSNKKEVFDIEFPESKIKEDEFFGKSEIFEESFFIKIYVKDKINSLNIIYQGCAEKGLCYPPIRKDLFLNSIRPDLLPSSLSSLSCSFFSLSSSNFSFLNSSISSLLKISSFQSLS